MHFNLAIHFNPLMYFIASHAQTWRAAALGLSACRPPLRRRRSRRHASPKDGGRRRADYPDVYSSCGRLQNANEQANIDKQNNASPVAAAIESHTTMPQPVNSGNNWRRQAASGNAAR